MWRERKCPVEYIRHRHQRFQKRQRFHQARMSEDAVLPLKVSKGYLLTSTGAALFICVTFYRFSCVAGSFKVQRLRFKIRTVNKYNSNMLKHLVARIAVDGMPGQQVQLKKFQLLCVHRTHFIKVGIVVQRIVHTQNNLLQQKIYARLGYS